jgi:hypothetical protein
VRKRCSHFGGHRIDLELIDEAVDVQSVDSYYNTVYHSVGVEIPSYLVLSILIFHCTTNGTMFRSRRSRRSLDSLSNFLPGIYKRHGTLVPPGLKLFLAFVLNLCGFFIAAGQPLLYTVSPKSAEHPAKSVCTQSNAPKEVRVALSYLSRCHSAVLGACISSLLLRTSQTALRTTDRPTRARSTLASSANLHTQYSDREISWDDSHG